MQEASAAISGRVRPLDQTTAAAAVTVFLGQAADVIGEAGRKLLASNCSSAAELAAVESALKSAIAGWRREAAGTCQFPAKTCSLNVIVVSFKC